MTEGIDLAFPYRETDRNGQYNDHYGMTKREVIAMHMMASLEITDYTLKDMAGDAVRMADALLEALNR